MNEIVTVIIPAYNCENTIIDTIDSVKSSSYKNIEIIVINDGSTDKTREIIEKIEGIKVFNNKNCGVSFTRNYGIDKASGRYIMFVDSDDKIDENLIYKLISRQKEKTILIGGLINVYNERGKCHIIKQKKLYEKREFIIDLLTGKVDGFCFRYLFDKNLLKNARFDVGLKYMEDTVFLINFIINNSIEKIEFVNANYNYLYNSKSVTNEKNNSVNRLHYIIKSIDQLHASNLSFIDYNTYFLIENKKAKLFESQIFLIDTKEEFNNFKSDNQIVAEIKKIIENKEINKLWRIYFRLIYRIPYFIFKLYKCVRKEAKKICKKKK